MLATASAQVCVPLGHSSLIKFLQTLPLVDKRLKRDWTGVQGFFGKDSKPTAGSSSSFTADMTPIILAAHRNNYEIVKVLQLLHGSRHWRTYIGVEVEGQILFLLLPLPLPFPSLLSSFACPPILSFTSSGGMKR